MPVFEITAPDGKTYDVEGPDAKGALAALTKALGGAAPKQEMVGFGERGQRETMEPESEDLKKEVRVAELMARGRPRFGAGDAFLQNYTFGLTDEAAGLAGGIASAFQGQDPRQGYQEGKEAEKRLLQEYAEQHPTANTIASLGGMLTGGLGRGAAEAAATTGAGRLLAPLVQGAPAASLGGRIAQGVGQGATQGALQGFGDGDGLTDSLIGAGTGAVVGLAVGGAIPVASEAARVATTPVRNMVRAALKPEEEAARRVAEARAKDIARGRGMDDAAYDAARANNQPVTNLERGGENTTALARVAGNHSPDARIVLDDVTGPRFKTQVERIDGALAKESKLGGNPEQYMEQAGEAARKSAGKFYDEAFDLGSGDVWSPRLEKLLQAPKMEAALKSAISKFKDEAVLDGYAGLNSRVLLDDTGNIQFNPKGGLTVRPDLKLWDLAKRELDSMASQAKRTGNKDERTYTALAATLRNELDSMGAAGAAYKKARDSAGKYFGAENAYDGGKLFAGSKGDNAREAMKTFAKLKPEERKLFREGYIQSMRDRMAELKNNRDATLSIMNSPGEMARARIALGKDGAERLGAQLEVEAAMDATRKAMGNSTTVRQYMEMGLMGAAGGGALFGTDPSSIGIGAIAGAATKWGRGKINERMATEVAKLLTSSDPKKIEALINLANRSSGAMEVVRAIRMSLVGAAAKAMPAALPATSE